LGFPTGRSFTSSTTRQQVFWHHHHRAINKFSGAVAGKKKTSARGVSHAHPLLYFKFCFYFIFTCIVLSKTQKKLVSFVVVFTCLLLVLLE
jgi:hypothetical protein